MKREVGGDLLDPSAAHPHQLDDSQALRRRVSGPAMGSEDFALAPKDVEFTTQEFGFGEGVIALDHQPQDGRSGRSQPSPGEMIGLTEQDGNGVDDLEDRSGGAGFPGALLAGPLHVSLPGKSNEAQTISKSAKCPWRPTRGVTNRCAGTDAQEVAMIPHATQAFGLIEGRP